MFADDALSDALLERASRQLGLLREAFIVARASGPGSADRLVAMLREIRSLDGVVGELELIREATWDAPGAVWTVGGMGERVPCDFSPHVYVIRAGTKGPIKIGYAANVASRLAGLQTASPAPLRLLAAVAGGRGLERDLHAFFARDRIRNEWFRGSADLTSFVRRVQAYGRPCLHVGPHQLSESVGLQELSDFMAKRPSVVRTMGASSE